MNYPTVRTDPEADAAYVAFARIGPGEAAEQIVAEDRDGNPLALLDLSSSGRILGIEILGDRDRLPGSFLAEHPPGSA
ncbi:DUF2283 domain-containing protein [Saccharopolyspora taberi]|uniref:DUF2283 domain-containing protein n=1 Tax=Saccharopolyspora taberi TaxID=60895 RepID=A0ABN3VMU9_9PSEU